ncbi:MAG: transposase [Candidatus Micrarchaeia archaeon]
MKSYKFRIYPSKQQETVLVEHLCISRDIWNSLLSKSKEKYEKEGKFYTKTELQKMVKGASLYSQAAQAVSHRLHAAIKRKMDMKRQHKKWGFPRFKSIGRMKIIYYPQSGFSLSEKLKVSPFGKITIVKHRQVEGKIRTLTLKREFSGKWFAIFCSEPGAEHPKMNNGPAVGMDLGLEKFAALSDGTIIKNPRHFKRMEKKLAFCHKLFSRKKKGSRNRWKARLKLARVYEKVVNCRKDFLHKTANSIISKYSMIAMEDLDSQELSSKGHGKGIFDAAWAMFTDIIVYKAGSAGCRIVLVDPKNTSQECSACGTIVKKTLWERQHVCQNCGFSEDRDLNASLNILKRATAGIAGSNACGDGTVVPSLKQETHTCRSG